MGGRATIVAPLMLVVALALAGCGGDDASRPPTPTVIPSGTATALARATATPSAAPSATQTPPPTSTAPPTATAAPAATDTALPTATASPSLTPTETPDESSIAAYAGRGPYAVGVTTLNIGDRDIEVWYPLDPGTEAGHDKASYASFTVLPEAIQQLLPPDLNIVVTMDAYRDLPVSSAGPFPVLTFSHGAGGFRQAYSGFLTGIASHGVVAASLEHLEWGLLAQVGLRPPGSVDRAPGEVVLAAVSRLAAASADPTSPLAGGVDTSRVITAGHSAGGRAAFALPDHPEVKAMIGFATGTSSSGVSGPPILLLAGAEDGGVGSLEDAYDDLSAVKRFVAIDHAGHNSFTDQCAIIHGGNNFLERLVEAGFPIPPALLELAIDGCRPENLPPAEFWTVAQHFTVAHMRAALGLDDPPRGLGAGIAGAFAPITLRYRFDDDASHPPAGVHGFVVSHFASVVPAFAAGACPAGFNLSALDRQMRGLPPIADDCADPDASTDPDFQTFEAPGTVDGWDLDGVASRRDDGRHCAHDDFAGPLGDDAFDLQLWRAVGCIRGFQPGELTDIVVDQAVRDGSMTILVEVRGLDDWEADDAVRVQVFGSLDAPPVGATGAVLPFGTLTVHPDGRYRGTVGTGTVSNGVLIAGPMDVRVPINIQIVAGDLTFRHAYLRLARQPDGAVRGQIFGYQPVEEFYDIFGRKAGQAGALALGYTCTGFHAALVSAADGDYDPTTGRCTSLSTGYSFSAVPAFIAR
jgi:dienelactone hydrolase